METASKDCLFGSFLLVLKYMKEGKIEKIEKADGGLSKNKEIKETKLEDKEKIESLKKITFSFLGRNYEIPISSVSEFEYPEDIKKESGIVGYERTVIDKDILSGLMDQISKDTNSPIHDRSMLFKDVKEKLLQDVIYFLSHGEYPNRSFCHIMGGYSSDENVPVYQEQFVRDKFFLQKIFSLDTISALKNKVSRDETREDVFYSTKYRGQLDLFNKKNNKLKKESLTPREALDHLDEINADESFIATTKIGGLVTQSYDLWLHAEPNIFDKRPSFGFCPDGFLKSYLRNALKKGNEIALANKGTVPSGRFVKSIIRILNSKSELSSFSRKERNKLGGSGRRGSYYHFYNYYSNRNTEEPINTKKDKKNIDKNFKDLAFENGYKAKWGVPDNPEDLESGEIFLPVFINCNEVPQLRWGHAKYASFYSSKGFNFLKFKHLKSLPRPNKP